jgi:hypothetical protein
MSIDTARRPGPILTRRTMKTKPSEIQIGGDHYKALPIQPAIFAEANELSFLEGCVIKRLCRWRRGGKGREDLLKARHEIDLLLEIEEESCEP